MNEIDLYVCDRTGDWIAPLPDANLNYFETELNRPGAAEFTIDPLSEGATEIEGIAREIQVWVDGSLEWQGVPWGLQGNSQQITVTCEGLMSLFTKRFVDRTSLIYTSLDQFTIAWNILTYAQSEAVEDNRDFNIFADMPSLSGIVRSREYKRDEHKMILDIMEEFDGRTLKNGFDWSIVVMGDGMRYWTPKYPKKGANKVNNAVEWDSEGERNIQDFSWNENFLSLATLAYVTGGSSNVGGTSIKMEGKYEDTAASAYWGQMQTVISDGSQLDTDWLDDRAEQEVNTRKDPQVVTEITAALGTEFALGDVEDGDWIPVTIDHGRIQVDAWHRIEKVTYKPNSGIDLKFGQVVAIP